MIKRIGRAHRVFARRSQFHELLAYLPRRYKRLIMVVADVVSLPLALWSAYALRLSDWWPQYFLASAVWLFPLLPIIGLAIFARLGLYRAVVRYIGVKALLAVTQGVLLLALLLFAAAYLWPHLNMPRSIPVIFALVGLVYVGGSRVLVRSYYQWLIKHYSLKQPVIIYGAGEAGTQLAMALNGGREFFVVAFLDDDRGLWGNAILGIPVYNPNQAPTLVAQHQPARILLALPTASKKDRKHALDMLDGLPVHVQTVPSLPEIVSGEASVDQFREVEVEDLLGRDPVLPRTELLDMSVRDKVVMVTGAGGSIGSELCRQILQCGPARLILFEVSEFALYQVDQELEALNIDHQLGVRVLPFLGSVCNRDRVRAIMASQGVQTVYHAAAYKHVPMVEHNLFEGVRNNVLGTQTVAELASECGLERCILISTDKAVRPTNVMGATKRLAELVMQDLAERASGTIFSMVRFGNVLGSSGSVVPLFRQQIAQGGPVTVTHPDITRFFMTIPEAALLVIQAGSMAQGGDVFVLDMGKPVKIIDLARRMIELSGLDVRNEENPEGAIAIEYTGLRPGEKLFEELLIGEDVVGTDHPKIMRASEEVLDHETLLHHLAALVAAEKSQDLSQARRVLRQAITGFEPSSPIADWLLPANLDTLGPHNAH